MGPPPEAVLLISFSFSFIYLFSPFKFGRASISPARGPFIQYMKAYCSISSSKPPNIFVKFLSEQMAATMEDSAAKEQSSLSGKPSTRLLRYPLRSASRTKEVKPPHTDSTDSNSATKRGRVSSSVTKSVSVLDLSGKEKSAKPPRRLSVPSKQNSSSAPKYFGNITPISEARSKRAAAAANQGKSDTPLSDLSKSSNRKKFNVLASASYWLTQIKHSEAAGKHIISIGFFKLALEAGCEPIQKMSDELKSYLRNHDLSGFEESVKELLEGYNISENYEPSEGSVTCSQVPAEPSQLYEHDTHSSSSSITDVVKLKPKSLDISSDDIHELKQSNEEVIQKDDSVKKTRRLVSKNSASSKPASEVRGRSMQRKPSKPIKQESAKDDDRVRKQGKKKPAQGEVTEHVTSPPKVAIQEDKENMVASKAEEMVTSAET